MIPILAYFDDVFPELAKQKDFCSKKVIEEEENLLRTLDAGLSKDWMYWLQSEILGRAMHLNYTIPGFPLILPGWLHREIWKLTRADLKVELEKQRTRSRAAAVTETGDWVMVSEGNTQFVGYDESERWCPKY